MKKIMVTGSGGFIGSHLVEQLLDDGREVIAFVRYNSKNNWGWLDTIRPTSSLKVMQGDIRDFDSVMNAMESCDTVFHLGALIGIPYSYVSPLAYIKTNIEGTYNILQASLARNVERVIVTSTSETYGTAQYVPIDENHPSVGQSPYAATKIAADQLAISFHRSFDLPVKIVRPFNTYGPRQSARAIIPTIISQILSGKKKIMLGSLHPTRDLTYVKDTVNGFIEIAASSSLFGEATNIGMDHEISMGDLVELIGQRMGTSVEIISDSERIRPGKSEVERLRCANKKIMDATRWKPRYDLAMGIDETIAFIENHLEMYKPDIFNV